MTDTKAYILCIVCYVVGVMVGISAHWLSVKIKNGI